MKRNILIYLFLCGHIVLMGQVVNILDVETGEPLELVTIASNIPNVSTISNIHGQADVTAFVTSEHIEFRVVGYQPFALSFSELKEQHFTIRMERSLFSVDEVVVSAARWKQISSEVPNKVQTISSAEIKLQQPQTTADLLSLSGKVFIQKSQQGGGSPMIRGFATNRLLYSVDGVRMNTAIFRGGNIQNVISLDPFALERVEVLYGPGSVIYGSDALGGVMAFQTITPQFSLNGKPLVAGSAVTRYSSANNEFTGHFNVNIGEQKWASVTCISSNSFGDLKMGSFGPDEYLRPFYVQRQDSMDVVIGNPDPKVQTPSGYSQINIMQKLSYRPNSHWGFYYGFHYSETSDYPRYDRHIRYKKGLPRYGEWYYGPQIWMMNLFEVKHFSKKGIYDQASIKLAGQKFEESRISRDMNAAERERRIENVNAYSVNLDFVKTFGLKSKLFYGGEIVNDFVESTGINENIETAAKTEGPARYPQSEWGSYAMYASGQYALNTITDIKIGIRYNQYMLHSRFDTSFYPFSFTTADINNSALTGSLGIVLHPGNFFAIRVNASTAFRSPNVDDVGKVFDSEPGSVTVPNPGLDAEYATNFDVGLVKIFSDYFKIDLTGYYTFLSNAMARRDFTLNGLDSIMYDGELSRVQAIQNAAKAVIFGFQGGIEVKLPSRFILSADYNYQKGEEELDDGTVSPSRHAAPAFGAMRLKYELGNLNIQVYTLFSGERRFDEMPEEEKGKDYMYAIDENGNPYSPAWYTLNFKAMYQMTENIILQAGLENITDQRYRPYSSGIVASGRNFILSLRASF